MIFTDNENSTWWGGLTEYDRQAILDTMIEKADTDKYRAYAEKLSDQYMNDTPFDPKDLRAIRRWGD